MLYLSVYILEITQVIESLSQFVDLKFAWVLMGYPVSVNNDDNKFPGFALNSFSMNQSSEFYIQQWHVFSPN